MLAKKANRPELFIRAGGLKKRVDVDTDEEGKKPTRGAWSWIAGSRNFLQTHSGLVRKDKARRID